MLKDSIRRGLGLLLIAGVAACGDSEDDASAEVPVAEAPRELTPQEREAQRVRISESTLGGDTTVPPEVLDGAVLMESVPADAQP